jgi:23S rRNA (uracil1939-C5)-methyltransferase
MTRRTRRRALPEPFVATIETLSHEGRGICHHNGKVVFAFAALPGEVCRLQIHKTTKNFCEANVVEIIEASAERIEPHCPHFSVCGGCSMQHLSSQDQLRYKQQSVSEMVEHSGIEVGEWLPALTSEPWGYRRKARLGVKYVIKKGRLLIGFRERSSPFLADMRQCPVLVPRVGEHLPDLMSLVEGLEAQASIAQIEVAADEQNTLLVVRHLEPLAETDLAALKQFARDSGFWIQLQPGGLDTIYPLYPAQQTLYLRPVAESEIAIRFEAGDFTQVNTEVNQKMVAQALRYLDLQADDQVLDLFCGLGNFTLPMAQTAAGVTGVEGDVAMVERARQNARENGIDNTDYHVANLETIDGSEPWLKRTYDKILLDPPRLGAASIVPYLPAMTAKTIVYVSCQPSTLVRDARELCAQGYHLAFMGLMDMFPQTGHVESMAVFKRN